MPDDTKDERVYMVSGRDQLGDMEVFASASRERAEARLREMAQRLSDIRNNFDAV